MKMIVFLDFDGVICTGVHGDAEDNLEVLTKTVNLPNFDLNFVKNLETLITETQADIVISSSWGAIGLEAIQTLWQKRGLPGKVIDIIPSIDETAEFFGENHFEKVGRFQCIYAYVIKNKIKNYVVLDDFKNDCNEIADHFVWTNFLNPVEHPDACFYEFGRVTNYGIGFTNRCLEKALDILNP